MTVRRANNENVPDTLIVDKVRKGTADLLPWQKYVLSCFTEQEYHNYPDHWRGLDGIWRFSTWGHLVDDTVRCFGTQMVALLSLTYRPKVIVEMGVHVGSTTMLLCKLNPQAQVHGVDISEVVPPYDLEVGYAALLQEPSNLTIHRGDSREFVMPKMVDMCFIDADHLGTAPYEDSRRAWENRNFSGDWCIAWDDYHPNNPDVKGAVDRFTREVGCDLHTVGSWVYIGTKVIGEEYQTMSQITPSGTSFTLIHFVFQTDPERIACMPNMTEFHQTPHHPNYQRSNDARAVTCPGCKKTDAYKTARVTGG